MARLGPLTRFGPLTWALALGGVALLVRLPLLVGRNDAPPNSDAELYLTLSDDLVEGRGFDRFGHFYTPGYPGTMAALRQLPGRTEDALVVSQHLLGVAVVAVIVLAAWRYFGRVAAIAAGALAAVTPLMATSEHQLLPDFLFGALVLAGGLLLAEALTRAPSPPLGLLALAGACFGLATWVKPAGQFLLLAPPLALLLATRSLRATLRGSAVALLAMVLVLSPWLYRNVDLFESPTMSNQSGATLYNRAFEVDGLPFPQESSYANLARRVQAQGVVGGRRYHSRFNDALVDETGLSSREAWNVQRELALTAILRNPDDYAVGTAKGVARSIWDLNHIESEGLNLRAELRREGRAVPQQLTTWTWMASMPLLLAWFVVSLGGAASLLLLFVGEERSRRAAAALLSVWLIVTLLTVLAHGGMWRYSMQLAPIAWILGSAGAVAVGGELLRRIEAKQAGRVSPVQARRW